MPKGRGVRRITTVMKEFNTEGVCLPEVHYMVDI
jgi:hypothetical protein